MVKSCTDKDLDKIKEDQKKTKGKEGEEMVFDQNSRSSSISSSDEEDLAERARSGGPGHTSKVEGGVAFLEKPREGIQGLIPGEKGKHEREDHEARDDEAAGATPA